MKIHKMTVVNIASLKGSHHIDFDQVAKTSNLFAITGPTGSGKSTLLNCISLALYGEVYKKGSSSADFVTMGESFGQIDLKFSHSGKSYLSHWKLKIRKKNGEHYKKPQLTRTLFKLSESDKEALEKSPEDIIGLNFSQFCKTSILNQGEFAKFLKSSFVERKDILEKFYEGDDISNLNIVLKDRISKLNTEKESYKNQVLGINQAMNENDIDDEKLKELETRYQNKKLLKEKLDELSKLIKDYYDQNQSVKNLSESQENLKTEITRCHEELNQATEISKKAKENADSAKLVYQNNKEKLNTAIKKFDRKNQIEKQKISLESQLESLNNEVNIKETKINQLNEKLSIKSSKRDSLVKENPLLEKFTSFELTDFEHQFETLYNNKINNQDHIKKLLQEINALKRDQTALENAKKELKSLWGQFNLDTQLQTQKYLAKSRDELQSLKNTVEEGISENDRREKNIKQTREKINKIEHLIKDEKASERELEIDIMALEKNLQLEKRQCHVNEFIRESQEKGTCVICGQNVADLSLSTSGEIDITQWTSQLEQKNKKLHSLRESLNEQKLKLLTFQKEKQSLTEVQQAEAARLRQKWNEVSDLPLLQGSANHEHKIILDNRIGTIETKSTQLEQKIIQFNRDEQKLNNTESQLFDIAKRLKSLILEEDRLQDRISELDLKKSEMKRNLGKDQDDSEFLKYLSYLAKQAQSLQNETKEIERLSIEINASTETLQNLLKQVSSKKQDFNLYRDELNSLQNYFKKEKIDYDPTIRLKELEENSDNFQEIFLKENDHLKKIQVKYAETKSRYETLQESLKAIINTTNETQAKLQGFVGEILHKNNTQLEEFFDILKKFNQVDLQSQQNNDVFHQSRVIFAEKLSQYTADLENLRQDFTRSQILLKQKKENEKKISNIEAIIEKLKETENQYEALNLLIGKDEFRNFVLARIENLLLQQTNKELDQLCQGRYRLTQTHKTNRLLTEFLVIDHFHGAQKRKISTLSGGETFMVSLALALALAEMTRGKTQIDSLFIDEGFGTLDQDAIEDVLELLIDMQNTGKQIGLISHVKKLTRRIPVNINLIKSESGLSDIEFIMN